MLEEVQEDIEQFTKIIESKNKQLVDLKNILKLAKSSFQELTKKTTIKTIHNKYKTTTISTTVTIPTVKNIH